MAINIFNNTIKIALNDRLKNIEDYFKADVIFYYGAMDGEMLKLVETL